MHSGREQSGERERDIARETPEAGALGERERGETGSLGVYLYGNVPCCALCFAWDALGSGLLLGAEPARPPERSSSRVGVALSRVGAASVG